MDFVSSRKPQWANGELPAAQALVAKVAMVRCSCDCGCGSLRYPTCVFERETLQLLSTSSCGQALDRLKSHPKLQADDGEFVAPDRLRALIAQSLHFQHMM